MYKKLLIIVCLIGLIGWGIYEYRLANEEETSGKKVEQASSNSVSEKNLTVGTQEGNKAPNFQLKTLEGTEIKLSDMKGKKFILNFWATWCPPCKAEMPHMQEFYLEQNKKEVEIIAVNLTSLEKNTDDIQNFIKDYSLTFPILLDSQGAIGETYQAFTIPTSYVIDSQGIIQKKIIGPMNKEMMIELIESVE